MEEQGDSIDKTKEKIKEKKLLFKYSKKIRKFFLDSLFKIKKLFRLGSYPDYIIVGAQKSGSSSLQYYLCKHSEIKSPLEKETHYFDKNLNKKLNWYKAFFPCFKKKRKKITGEATPGYIFLPICAKRIHNLLPNVKIIAVLRNPVDRAYSHYNMRRKSNRNPEKLSFEEAIEKETERVGNIEKYTEPTEELFNYSYLARGRYLEQLKRYFKYFSKDQILVLRAEDLREQPQEELNKVFDFLNIRREKIPITIRHEGKYSSKMNPKTRKKLEKYFKPYNKKLYKYLGKDFGW